MNIVKNGLGARDWELEKWACEKKGGFGRAWTRLGFVGGGEGVVDQSSLVN